MAAAMPFSSPDDLKAKSDKVWATCGREASLHLHEHAVVCAFLPHTFGATPIGIVEKSRAQLQKYACEQQSDELAQRRRRAAGSM